MNSASKLKKAYQKSINEIKKKIRRLDEIRVSPKLFVNNHFDELIRQTDLATENTFGTLDRDTKISP